MARLAHSLETLRTQIDNKFPNRSKASDGWIGDAAHAARLSQHNPNTAGVVCAIDITEDESVGLSCNQLMEELDASNDNRIFYLIHDRQIDNSDDSRTPYNGPNPHTKHMHISVYWQRPDLYDDGREWQLPMLGTGVPAPAPVDTWYRGALGSRILENGKRGSDVSALQSIMNRRFSLYSKLNVDGEFGAKTEQVIREFQKRSKLTADGIVGRKTYRALGI